MTRKFRVAFTTVEYVYAKSEGEALDNARAIFQNKTVPMLLEESRCDVDLVRKGVE